MAGPDGKGGGEPRSGRTVVIGGLMTGRRLARRLRLCAGRFLGDSGGRVAGLLLFGRHRLEPWVLDIGHDALAEEESDEADAWRDERIRAGPIGQRELRAYLLLARRYRGRVVDG